MSSKVLIAGLHLPSLPENKTSSSPKPLPKSLSIAPRVARIKKRDVTMAATTTAPRCGRSFLSPPNLAVERETDRNTNGRTSELSGLPFKDGTLDTAVGQETLSLRASPRASDIEKSVSSQSQGSFPHCFRAAIISQVLSA